MEFAVFTPLPGPVVPRTPPVFVDQVLTEADGAPPNRTTVGPGGRTAVVRMPRAARPERP
ncbi:hypothetical protein [Streptomyces sp. NPDC127072]|uniref:hypothetical protein n=1 Tax=Streptomyces sp. NPDC127072 TaxID=3347129 RepID=UPI003668F33F